MPYEDYVTGAGQSLHVHSRKECTGEWCVIHNPMPGEHNEWPTYWRDDRRIMERTCPHGVGHPTPEYVDYVISVEKGYEAIHGCCGCPCYPPDHGRDV